METKMTEVERHRFKMLQKVYETWLPPTPVLKNRDIDIPNGMVPYISCSDVHDYKYNVRIISYDDFFTSEDNFEKTEAGELIASYESLEDMVIAGWMLD
jgi:hypothetical protein